MSDRPLVRRTIGLVGAAALGLAALTSTAPPASAAVFTGTAAVQTLFSTGGGGGCALSADTSTSQTLPLSSGGAPAAFSIDSSAVATDPGDPADTTALAASLRASMSATEAAGVLTAFDLTATSTLKVDRAQDALSSCISSAQASTVFTPTTPFAVVAPTMLDLTVKAHGTAGGTMNVIVSKVDPIGGTMLQLDSNNTQTSHRLIPLAPGQYTVTVVASAILNQPDSLPQPETASLAYSVHGDLAAPGSPSSVQKGTGNKYLTLGSGVSCGAHSLTADFQKAAGKKAKKGKKPVINKATFYVDDVKVTTVKKPHKNTLTTLSGLPDGEVTVEAVLKVRGKGIVNLWRTYRPCS